jgi:hypothetical protein
LHVALAKGLEEAAGVLVERGAKVTAKDKVRARHRLLCHKCLVFFL